MFAVGIVLMFLVIVPLVLGIIDVVGPAVTIVSAIVLFGSGAVLVSNAVEDQCRDKGGVSVERGICFSEDGRRIP
jgi:hypothetical protein